MQLEYQAPDIYPAGVKLERVLTLRGDQNVVIEDTAVTPKSIQAGQAYVLENSEPRIAFVDAALIANFQAAVDAAAVRKPRMLTLETSGFSNIMHSRRAPVPPTDVAPTPQNSCRLRPAAPARICSVSAAGDGVPARA